MHALTFFLFFMSLAHIMRIEETKCNNFVHGNTDGKGLFPLQAWNGAFFVSFTDFFTPKILASAKQSKKNQ